MSERRGRTGRPVAVLGGLLALWVSGRALVWQSPFPMALPPLPDTMLERLPVAVVADATKPAPEVAVTPQASPPMLPAASAWPVTAAQPVHFFDPAALASRGEPFDETSGHQLMWLASLTDQVARPAPFMAAAAAPRQAAPFPVIAARAPADAGRADRWSLTGWVFLREGSTAAGAVGAGPTPSYGGSQAGGVLRYRLAPASPARPEAYVRVSSAVHVADDRELAAGLAVRPVTGVPVALMGEGRVRERNGRMIVRPAVMAVTELAPQRLPAGLEAELYLQAGYVAAPDATAFGDGQLRVTADLARFEAGALRAGGGAWLGAQRGAARADIGPTVQLDLRLGRTGARLGLDYRVRVAGDAAPDTGVALTLSTGF